MASRRLNGLVLIAGLALGPCEARDLERQLAVASSQPCTRYGSGFVRVPGSASCLRLSGRVRAEAEIRAGHAAKAPIAAGRLAIDTRTESDLGPVRTYVRIGNGRR